MTLVEMMVAIGITAIVMAISISIFVAQYSNYKKGQSVKEVQEAGQGSIDFLKTDLMEAGWSVRPDMAFYFEDGGSSAPDRIWINDTSIVKLTDTVGKARLLNKYCAGGLKIASGSGSQSLTLSDPGQGTTTSELVNFYMQSGTNPAEFIGGISQYAISDGKYDKVAKVVTASDDNLSLDTDLLGDYVAPAIYYCVDTGTSECHPSGTTETRVLRRSDRKTNGLQPMIEDVVDLQVAYKMGDNWYGLTGCSESGAGSGFCTASPFQPTRTTLIRVSVMTRGTQYLPDRKYDPAYCRPALENRTAASRGSAECGYIYRTYTVLVQPRSTGPLYQ